MLQVDPECGSPFIMNNLVSLQFRDLRQMDESSGSVCMKGTFDQSQWFPEGRHRSRVKLMTQVIFSHSGIIDLTYYIELYG
jgi:hypothetical protein